MLPGFQSGIISPTLKAGTASKKGDQPGVLSEQRVLSDLSLPRVLSDSRINKRRFVWVASHAQPLQPNGPPVN